MVTTTQMNEFIVKAAKAIKAGKLFETTTVYVNKKDSEDSFTTFEDAFKRGLNLQDYEAKTTGILGELKELLSNEDKETITKFYNILVQINKGREEQPKITKAGTINNRLNKLYKEFDQLVKDGAAAEKIKECAAAIEKQVALKGDKARESKKLKEVRAYLK